MTPETRAGLLEDLAAHVAHRAPGLLGEPVTPAACPVLLAIELACVALVVGPYDLPEHGVRSVGAR